MNYYNDNDRFAAQWLRNLIAAELIPQGHVDERSIKEVTADDLKNYTQCHFFAGIAGWSLALALAGWPTTTPVWTGSCPCQPFSAAGKRKGTADDRHLWPEFRRLIAECRPATVFGEQVASKDGREWLTGVRADLEGMGYAVGAADLCAASVGAPHIRQRLWWVADADGWQASDEHLQRGWEYGQRTEAVGDLATASRLEYATGNGRQKRRSESNWWGFAARLGDDGFYRRIAPRVEPLAARLPGRVGRLRAYGNAIVPQVAAEFIGAYMDLTDA